MAGSLAERLQLVVDATTGQAEASFARLSSSAKDSDDSARKAGLSVAAAADRVAQARAKEADAAGNVRVAEARLNELREKGNASQSQLARAEVAVERARRQQHLATRDLTQATEAQTAANDDAARSTDDAGSAAEGMSLDVKELAKTAGGLLAGVSLGDWARDAVSGFVEGARGAAAMATSMNATVEEAGAFLGLVGSVGLELDDLLEIQAEFAGKTKDGLTQLGTELQHNADGTVNWTNTLVDTLGELQKIPDATERNRLGFSMFGEEGYKQLSRLLNSGTDVATALEMIGTPFTQEDVALAAEYDAAMLELGLTSGELSRTLGRALVPIITGLIDAGQTVADVIGAIPAPVLAAGGAAVVLGLGMRMAATEGSFVAGAMARATAATTAFGVAAARTGATSAAASLAMGGLRRGAGGLMSALGGPVGLALIGVGVGIAVVSDAVDTFESNARRVAVESELARQKFGEMAASSEELGAQMADDAGAVDGWVASVRGAGVVMGEFRDETGVSVPVVDGFLDSILGTADSLFDLGLAEAGAAAEIDNQREALGAATLQQETAQVATKTLSDLIAEGTTSGQEFTDALTAAAEAQANESRTSDLASASIEAYNAITRDAVQTTLDLYSATLGQRDGLLGVQKAFYEVAETVDDAETPWNEVTEATNQALAATLDYGSSAADAAVAAARAAGTVLDPLTEGRVRAEATIAALKESLNDPNMTADARGQLEVLIGQLETAAASGDIEALLSLTGGPEVAGELDETTADRETAITIESRGGPAVVSYLDKISGAARFALIRVESRNGPAVLSYLRALADAKRFALIRVESRNGPAVNSYLGTLARERLAIIRVETRGGPAVDQYLDNLAATRRAIIEAQGAGSVRGAGSPMLRGAPSGAEAGQGVAVALRTLELDLRLTGSLDRGQVSKAERGRAHVEDIRAYEQRNGTGWRAR